ncbi:phage/plasmid replication protein%2C gene II/X family [Streptococcus pneumoniae]|uniref:phage/plasmid replication domain-containing protein n=1 Tax=Bacillus paranthracis TaxID=2026186 RepID=UPI0005E1E8F9|nr:phage/plasmid replication protein [Bacillus paranthracis]CKE81891.1 phage/plasmid replication protein%2C gene II/X family [Bacillus paranthracis]CKF09582.1 phage/plasmid replication protein%2C gene II/X family [Streptococcus pneumoniae]CKF36280.1 phage/plasmid replication protein%2C gene II/X family [Streptococcus pneumoniae]CKG69886.1 phage/plasmid replication protein%2C gene II/X family [Streptococcus pneumoniae]
MFDTVTLIAFGIELHPEQLEGAKSFTYINDEGEYITKISLKKGRISYKYYLQKQILEIELSIPKLMYGTNIKMIKESDIQSFWIQLHNILCQDLGISIDTEQWKVKRVDISYNFKVDNVRMWIAEISKKDISRRTKITYNRNETVIFKNKSSSICFYDKEKECIYKKESKEVIEQAKGILRLEIRPASYHLKEYSSNRSALELISKDFFTYIIEKFRINDLLIYQDEKADIELFKVLDVMKIADIEKIMGYKVLVECIGEKMLLEKGYYKEGTLRNRKILKEEYDKNINQKGIKQPQLHIMLD